MTFHELPELSYYSTSSNDLFLKVRYNLSINLIDNLYKYGQVSDFDVKLVKCKHKIVFGQLEVGDTFLLTSLGHVVDTIFIKFSKNTFRCANGSTLEYACRELKILKAPMNVYYL